MLEPSRTYAVIDEHAPLAMEEAVILGSNVERLRLKTGMGITAFCTLAGMSRPFLYKIESGEANPKLSELKKLANALGVSVVELLTPAQEQGPAALPDHR